MYDVRPFAADIFLDASLTGLGGGGGGGGASIILFIHLHCLGTIMVTILHSWKS